MVLTSAQLVTLKNYIAADPTLSTYPHTSDGAFAVANLLNLTATPVFYVWRTDVGSAEIRGVLDWNEYDGLSVSKQNAFSFLCLDGKVDASKTNVQAGILSIFTSAQSPNTRAALIALAKRLARVIEKVFATGTGSLAAPATMAAGVSGYVEGPVSFQTVQDAWNS